MPMQEIKAGDERSLQDIADLLVKSHKILLITGAGISTSCGIPDFRSKEGLYNLIPADNGLLTPRSSAPPTPLKKRDASGDHTDESPPSSQSSVTSLSSQRSSAACKLRGQDLFDSRVWKDADSTAVFYQFMASLRRKVREEVNDSSSTHKFIRTLRDGGRLMRCYTQNIDGLEVREGLCMDMRRGKGSKKRYMKRVYETPRPSQTSGTEFDGGCEIVPLHGDLDKLRCTLCQDTCNWTNDADASFVDGRAPSCQKCQKKSDERKANGKRGVAVGLLRPNIVLYGEEHPSNQLLAPFVPFDVGSNPEVLIIMGTSLKVFGLQKVVRDFAKSIHSRKDGKGKVVFVNRTKPAESIWDGIIDDYIAMDCDNWIRDLRCRRDDLWLRQGEIELKVTKPTSKRKADDTEAEEKPAKKSKKPSQIVISVDIPRKSEPKSASATQSPSKIESSALRAVAPSRDQQIKIGQPSWHNPRTPRHPRYWRHDMYDNYLDILSPERPHSSPLTPDHSPITPFHRKTDVEVYKDPDTEIPESEEDVKGTGVGHDIQIGSETPSRMTSRRPLSVSRIQWSQMSARGLYNSIMGGGPADGVVDSKPYPKPQVSNNVMHRPGK